MKRKKILSTLMALFMILTNVLNPQLIQTIFADSDEPDTEDVEEKEDGEDVEVHDLNDDEDSDGDDDVEQANPESDDDGNQEDNESDDADDKGTEDEEEKDNKDPPAGEKDKEKDTDDSKGISGFRSKNIPTSAAEGKDLGNIFTFEYFKINDKNNPDIISNDIIDIEEGTKAIIQFEWDTKEKNAKNGDKASIQLPDFFKQITTPNQPIIVKDENNNDITVGNYSIQNGQLELIFNEEIERDDVENGHIGLELDFNLEKIKENIKQEIKFNDSKDTTLNIIVKPKKEANRITKEGSPDKNHDAREITWTVDVLNTDKEEITDAMIQDNIPEGLELQEGSFVVNELSVKYEGDKIVVGSVEATPTKVSKEDFEFTFESIKPFQGYRIKYTTTITDFSKESFTNDAHLTYGDKDLPADATVDGLTRSDSIEKDGKYSGKDEDGNDLIEWTILVNKSGGEIENAIIEDELPEGLKFVEDSIEVEKFQDDGAWADPQPDGPFNEFPVELGKVEANEFYKITFQSTVDWSEVNDGEYQQNNEFINKTHLYDGETKIDEDDATVSFNRESILEKIGASKVSYNDKTIIWTVDVNKANHPLNDVVITDTLPKGLKISKENVEIKGVDVSDDKITITENADRTTTVKVDLGDIGTEYVEIKYYTTIINFDVDDFKNVVGITGNGIGEGDHTRDDSNVTPPPNNFSKAFKGIDYNKKTIEWEFIADPLREAITELEITDTFPNKGMIFLPDTLEIKVGDDELEEDEDYTLEQNGSGYHQGFVIKLTDKILPLNAKLIATYETSYDPQKEVDGNTLEPHINEEKEVRVYKNNANFKGNTQNSHDFDTNRPASKIIREDAWNSGKKEGQLVHEEDGKLVNGWVSGQERKVAWQLYTNYQEQNLGKDVVITDTLDYGGTIDKDSVKISIYTVDKEGNTNITDEVLDPNKYDLDVDGKEFTLRFKEEVKKRYVVEFTTTVPDISQEKYINQATVKVGNAEYPYKGAVHYDKHNKFLDKNALLDGKDVYTGEEIEWDVKVNESLSTIKNAKLTDTISSGLIYLNDSLKIFKLEGNKEIELEEGKDYSFEAVPNTNGETVLEINFQTKITSVIVLEYKTVVTETSGEVSNKVSLKGTGITSVETDSETLSASQFSWVDGQFSPKKGALRITKVDSEELDDDNHKIVINQNETEFTLEFDLNGERVQFGETFTTKDGVLELGNLPLRTYYLKEKTSPTGYTLSEKELEIEVTKAYNNIEDNIVKNDFENTKEKISITGKKEWENGPKERPTTWFKLYRTIGENDPEEVTEVEIKELTNDITSVTWEELDKTNSAGEDYIYSVKEVDKEGKDSVPTNYKKSEVGLEVTNTYVSPKREVTATKEWIDGPEEKPTTWFKLYRTIGENDPEEVTEAEIKELTNDTASVTWEELDKTDSAGENYIYSVKEVDKEGKDSVPINYKKSEVGLEVTNTYVSPKREVTATKEWINGPEEKPTTWFKLYRTIGENGSEEVTEAEIKELTNDTASVTWEELDKTNSAGEDYIYSVKEVDKEGKDSVPTNYEKSEIGLEVINTYVSPRIDIIGKKEWVGGPKNKPSIKIQLYRNGVEYGDKEILRDGQTEFVWKNLLETDILGVPYEYSIKEIGTPSEYNKTEKGLTVVNTRKTYAIGDYTWIDENKDGIQDDNEPVLPGVKVELYDETGEKIADTTTNEDGLYIFDELEAGNYKVKFILTEEQAELYEFTKLTKDNAETDSNANPVAGDDYGWTVDIELNEGNEFLTKSYEDQKFEATEGIDPTWDAGVILREKIDISGSKTWNDSDNQDGKRPESITINLLADGKEIDSEKVTAEDDDWSWTFKDLYKSEAGSNEDIVYTITEKAVKDYSTVIKGHDYDYIVTNSYTPGKTSVQVTKAWVGEKGKSVDVKLLADGKDTGEVLTLTADNNWTGTFIELDEYKAGKLIEYTVEEVEIDEYYTEVTGDVEKGFVITNTQKTYAIGDYTWIDENKDGIQDDDEPVLPGVKVELFDEDGKKVAETTTDKNGRYIFDELPAGKYKVKFTLTKEQAKKYEFTQQHAGKDDAVDSNADSKTGWTIDIVLNDENSYLTKDYTDQDFKATEGIDPTWDAGVILKDIPEDPKDPEKPEEPSKPEESDKDEKESKDDSNLPKTGETTFVWLAISLILIGLGLAFVKEARKEE